MLKHKVIKGDLVLVRTGKDKGKTGKVLELCAANGKIKVKVEGCNYATHFVKSTQDTEGGLIRKEKFIDISNVSLYDSSSGCGSRVFYKLEDGKKVRCFRKTGLAVDGKGE